MGSGCAERASVGGGSGGVLGTRACPRLEQRQLLSLLQPETAALLLRANTKCCEGGRSSRGLGVGGGGVRKGGADLTVGRPHTSAMKPPSAHPHFGALRGLRLHVITAQLAAGPAAAAPQTYRLTHGRPLSLQLLTHVE